MKDSRIGTYGTVALVLAVGLRAALMVALLTTRGPGATALAIVAAATFGRRLVVVMMAGVAPVPDAGGLAKDIGTGVGGGRMAMATLAAIPGSVAFAIRSPIAGIEAVAGAALFVLWFRALLLRRIGGSTGDCLGFAAYAGQLLVLLAASPA